MDGTISASELFNNFKNKMVFTVSKGVSKSVIIDEVNSSPETLWSTIIDIESMPHFISTIKKVKVLGSSLSSNTADERYHIVDAVDQSFSKNEIKTSNKNDNKVKEGFAWEETRYIMGREATLIKYITCIGSNTSIVNRCNSSDSNSTIATTTSSMIQHQQKNIRINATVTGKSQKKHRHGSKTFTIFVDWDEEVTNYNYNVNSMNDIQNNVHDLTNISESSNKSTTNNSSANTSSVLLLPNNKC